MAVGVSGKGGHRCRAVSLEDKRLVTGGCQEGFDFLAIDTHSVLWELDVVEVFKPRALASGALRCSRGGLVAPVAAPDG